MKQRELLEILNGLTCINRDRIEGYMKAIKELDKYNTVEYTPVLCRPNASRINTKA